MKTRGFIVFSVYIMVFLSVHTSFSQEGRPRLRALVAGKKAMELYRAGQYAESAEIFKQILEKNKKNIISKEMLALIGLKTKNSTMAEQYARAAVLQNTRSVRAHLVLGYIARENGNKLAALDHYRKAQKYATTKMDKEFLSEYTLKLERPRREDLASPSTVQTVESASDVKPYVAVFAFEESGADSSGQLGQTISEMLITALMQTNRFAIFERSQLNKILEEQALGLSGALDTETAVDVGQLIGVDAILAGSCSRIGDRIEVDARLIQASSGEIKAAAHGTIKMEQEMRQAVEVIAGKLAAHADQIDRRRVKQ